MKIIIGLGIVISLLASLAFGATWTVEKDGSGDFDDIQPAVDAAAAGDTILVGPGRFDTFGPVVAPAWTEETVVWVTKDNLTFIGSGKEVTLVGTASPYWAPGTKPKSFCSIGSFDGRIENMTIENVSEGIYWYLGDLVVEDCVIRGNNTAYVGIGPTYDSLTVLNCEFEILHSGAYGIASHPPTSSVEIGKCKFSGIGTGLATVGTSGLRLYDTSFEGLGIGAQFDNGSMAEVWGCTFFENYHNGIEMSYNSVVDVHDVHISGSWVGLDIGAGSVLTGTEIIVENCELTSLLLNSQVYVSLTNSHLLPSEEGWAVYSTIFPYEHIDQDLQGNYWGTSDPDSIDAIILDSNDRPDYHFTVLYEPFEGAPVPVEQESWGSFKSMFR